MAITHPREIGGDKCMAKIITPASDNKILKDPWLSIWFEGNSSFSISPSVTRESAQTLRALADDIDQAYAQMDYEQASADGLIKDPSLGIPLED
jgi:hypothetical protein